MANLTRASQELFRRAPDEVFGSLQQLRDHCQQEKEYSSDCWHPPQTLAPHAAAGSVSVKLGDDGAFLLNDWSFAQLCRMSGVNKETVNSFREQPTPGE